MVLHQPAVAVNTEFIRSYFSQHDLFVWHANGMTGVTIEMSKKFYACAGKAQVFSKKNQFL